VISFHTFEDEFKTVSPNQQRLALLPLNHQLVDGKDDEDESDESIDSQRLKLNDSKNLFGSTYRRDDEHIRAAEDEQSSSRWGYLITQVIDSGEGIQPKVLKNLFTTFT